MTLHAAPDRAGARRPAEGSAVLEPDFGRRRLTVRRKRVSWSVSARGFVMTVVVGLLAGIGAILSIAIGTSQLSLGEVLSGLLGTADPGTVLIVREWRMPRALLAALFGVALGMSGAVFQSLTRNPLGSPDVIGFSSGSYTGALIVLLVTGGGYVAVAAGALVGGVLTALAVFLLAYRGGVQGFRLIIVGIGVSAMLAALNTYLMLRASAGEQLTAAVWGSGSLNGLTAETLIPVAVILALLLVPTMLLSRPLRALELGDDAAGSLGVRSAAVRFAAILTGVALVALVTSAAGPIAFIALVAPQIARRLTRSADVGVVASGAVGALLLVLSDFIGQRLFSPLQLPVGIVTVSVGGIYFIWLLIREAQRR